MTRHLLDPQLQATTRKDVNETRLELAVQGIVALTVLWHPDPLRIGEEAGLVGLAEGESLSRLSPHFARSGGTPKPLGETHLSRRPLRLFESGDGIRLEPGGTKAEVDGVELVEPVFLSTSRLGPGVVILLAQRVVLLLHRRPALPTRPTAQMTDLIGESDPMIRLRQDIERVSDSNSPVLLRGESGTGKELVARAIHQASPRRDMPFRAVNVGALRAERADAELFGAAKGAYTGATRKRRGFFQAAEGGTLFLDEIGEASDEIQVLLLRALEEGEIQPVGTVTPIPVNVRLISATDADLESALKAKTFRRPLYHRLAVTELELPPLRWRKPDLGLLCRHFLEQELEAVGERRRLETADREPPWFPARLIARMVSYPWPGNVRELRNAMKQVVVLNRDRQHFVVPDRLERLLASHPPAPEAPCPPRKGAEFVPVGQGEPSAEAGRTKIPGFQKRPEDFSKAEVQQAMAQAEWHVRRAAEILGIKPSSMYNLMARDGIRTAKDLTRSEIVEALAKTGGQIAETARLLEVSKRGLQLQITRLQIE